MVLCRHAPSLCGPLAADTLCLPHWTALPALPLEYAGSALLVSAHRMLAELTQSGTKMSHKSIIHSKFQTSVWAGRTHLIYKFYEDIPPAEVDRFDHG
jgi:hypothetical protein